MGYSPWVCKELNTTERLFTSLSLSQLMHMLGWVWRQVIRMLYDPYKNQLVGTSLVAQWLRLCAPNAGGMGLKPDPGTKIPHATWPISK